MKDWKQAADGLSVRIAPDELALLAPVLDALLNAFQPLADGLQDEDDMAPVWSPERI